MNYLSAILGLALMGAISTAALYRGDANSWHGKYDSLQTSYKTAAVAAETHAQATEAAQAIAIQIQSAQAIQQAQSQALQARNRLTEYQAKLAAAASVKDDGHRCAGVKIPSDLVPQ